MKSISCPGGSEQPPRGVGPQGRARRDADHVPDGDRQTVAGGDRQDESATNVGWTDRIHDRASSPDARPLSAPVRVISPEVRETRLKERHFSGKTTAQDLARRRLLSADDRVCGRGGLLCGGKCGAGDLRAETRARRFPVYAGGGERALAVDGVIAQAPTMVADVRKFYEWDWGRALLRAPPAEGAFEPGAYGQGPGCPIAPCVSPLGSARSGSARRGTSCARGRITTTVG